MNEANDRIEGNFAEKTIRLDLSDTSRFLSHNDYVGQRLDEKYRLERLLGHGGMGAVYLATHLGTGRYVAVKLITPEFMRNPEFVERFKREARAAGRLRHPNIVDVTDFGFARAGDERVAYLVMEYLDGCTLGSVLAEEKRLPLYWVIDLLEQVCSAVHEAHKQGIVHRDLKPDNVWLEPNSLGGYRVKVLDFGIAKLAEAGPALPPRARLEKGADKGTIRVTAIQGTATPVNVLKESAAPLFDAFATPAPKLVQPPPPLLESRSMPARPQEDGLDNPLTRMGAILGTPAFMSPEQCRGEHLDARSDVYSLGVIAYLMLSGTTPFTGEAAAVIRAHVECQPKPLRKQTRTLHKRIARLIMTALAKDPAERPQTAMAFANALRANAEGLGALYRRAFALYSEHFPKVIKLSLLAHIPVLVVMLLTMGLRAFEPHADKPGKVVFEIILGLLNGAASFVTASTIAGVIVVIVAQSAVKPLKVVELRAAFAVLRRRWRPFLWTGLHATVRIALGFIFLLIPGLVMLVRYSLWAPVVLIDGLEKKAALQRSGALVSRSWRIMIFAMFFQFLIPVLLQGLVSAKAPGGLLVKIIPQLASLTSIFALPLVSIVPALLYLKMRQLGGETLTEMMAQIETEGVRSKWEQRMRERLTGYAPPT